MQRSATPLAVAWTAILVLFPMAPQRAHAQGGIIECSADKTFFPRGDHWPVVPPAAANPIEYVNQAQGPVQSNAMSPAVVHATVDRAFAAWTDISCRGDGASPNIAVSRGPDYPQRNTGNCQ